MTFTIKQRGAGGLMLAEYMCPEHGRFEQLVTRDENGNPPASAGCTEAVGWEGRAMRPAGTFGPDDVGDDGQETTELLCGQRSEYVISAVSPKKDTVSVQAVVRGGDMKDRPPGMLDTRPLAEGMSQSEWKKVQKKHQEERRHHQLIERGLKTKKIQVG